MKTASSWLSAMLLGLALGACSSAQAPGDAQAAAPALGPTSIPNVSIVASSPADLTVTSTPAAGSIVGGPVYQLSFDFSRPVALAEVMVTGPDGKMPMMLSSAGEQVHFSVPLAGLESGAYTVEWKALAAGQERRGTFAFTVK